MTNLKFTLVIEDQVMQSITADKKEPNVAANELLRKPPRGVLTQWLADVKISDGSDALTATKSYLATR